MGVISLLKRKKWREKLLLIFLKAYLQLEIQNGSKKQVITGLHGNDPDKGPHSVFYTCKHHEQHRDKLKANNITKPSESLTKTIREADLFVYGIVYS